MRRPALAALALLVLAAAPAERSTEAFYRDALALKAKGAMALFAGNLRPLMAEGQAAGVAARDQRRAAVARGERPAYCPPQHGAINSEEMLTLLGRIPAEERARLPLSQGMARAFAAKWPCR